MNNENFQSIDRACLTRRNLLRAGAVAGLTAGLGGRTLAQDDDDEFFDFDEATDEAYWYGRFNAESLVLSGNGVLYPRSQGRREEFDDLLEEMEEIADLEERPVRGLRSLTIAPYRRGNPSYTERPVFNPRLSQPTLLWEEPQSQIVTPSSFAWSNLAYILWSLSFEDIGDPTAEDDGDFWALLYGQAAQRGIDYAYLAEEVLRDEEREEDENGGDSGDDDGDDDDDDVGKLFLNRFYDAGRGSAERSNEEQDRPLDYAATLWALSWAVEFAEGALGYDEPTTVFDIEDVEELADRAANTVTDEISGSEIIQKVGMRGVGTMLSAIGQYGAVGDQAIDEAEEYADSLVSYVIDNLDEDGRVDPNEDGAHQAAVQGAVGQGLVWVSSGLGTDAEDEAEDVLDYLLDDLWSESDGTFDDERDERTITVTARDAGDIIGGLNAAEELLDTEDIEDIFPEFFNSTINRGRLQRAERSLSRNPEADFPLPLPGNVGGQFGEAPVFNRAVEYDVPTDEWTVTSGTFVTEDAMYAACQCTWIGEVEGDAFPDRGLP